MKDQVVKEVPIDQLKCLPQVRDAAAFADGDIAGLAQSIAECDGIHIPLLARREGDQLVVLDGERRLRAAKMAGLSVVPVIIKEESMSDAEVTHCQLVLDAQRVGLTPMERARAIDRLMTESGWSAAQVAVKLGLSAGNISKLLALLVLPESVQQQVASGQLAMSTAYELAKVPDDQDREQLIDEAATGGLTRNALLKKRKSLGAKRSPERAKRAPRRRERVVLPLGEDHSITVHGNGLTLGNLLDGLQQVLGKLKVFASKSMEIGDALKALKGDKPETRADSTILK